MTVEERINAMNKKINNDKIIKEEKELLEKQAIDNEMKNVSKLFARIKDVIRLGIYCRENNIKFPKGEYHKYYDQAYNDFESDGIRHFFGFIGKDGYCSHGEEIHVGWNNGGFCGEWDVHCDGNKLWLQHEKDKTNKKDVDSLDVIKRFIKDFEEFEKNFYEWFDKKCNQY